jgi:hypothetical protein
VDGTIFKYISLHVFLSFEGFLIWILLPEPFSDAPHVSFAYLFLALIFIRLIQNCIFIIKFSALFFDQCRWWEFTRDCRCRLCGRCLHSCLYISWLRTTSTTGSTGCSMVSGDTRRSTGSTMSSRRPSALQPHMHTGLRCSYLASPHLLGRPSHQAT